MEHLRRIIEALCGVTSLAFVRTTPATCKLETLQDRYFFWQALLRSGGNSLELQVEPS